MGGNLVLLGKMGNKLVILGNVYTWGQVGVAALAVTAAVVTVLGIYYLFKKARRNPDTLLCKIREINSAFDNMRADLEAPNLAPA